MASLPSHTVAALCIGTCFYKSDIPKRIWVIGAACSVVPDLDVIGFRFGIHYGDFWGHRGFTHSLLFAALLALFIVVLGFRHGVTGMSPWSMSLFFFFATASHGLLDAMTNGGLGVAFFAPFDTHRYFLPWTPIRVSPIGVGRFFGAPGVAVLRTEILWIWVPATILAVSAILLRRRGATAPEISHTERPSVPGKSRNRRSSFWRSHRSGSRRLGYHFPQALNILDSGAAKLKNIRAEVTQIVIRPMFL